MKSPSENDENLQVGDNFPQKEKKENLQVRDDFPIEEGIHFNADNEGEMQILFLFFQHLHIRRNFEISQTNKLGKIAFKMPFYSKKSYVLHLDGLYSTIEIWKYNF